MIPCASQVPARGRGAGEGAAPEDGDGAGEDGAAQGRARRERHRPQDGAAGDRQGRAGVQEAPRREAGDGRQVGHRADNCRQNLIFYMVTHLLGKKLKTSHRLGFDCSGSWWAATAATYCPGRMEEHPKSKSTKDLTTRNCHPVQ